MNKKTILLVLAILGGILLIRYIVVTQYESRMFDVYVPTDSVAKVSDGDLFGLRERETPFTDSPTSISLWMMARGVKDMPAIESMIKSGRVIFVPYDTYVDVLEHDEKNIATKVRIRGGTYIGHEVWTHPKFVTPIN
jgi:hypothetical protein